MNMAGNFEQRDNSASAFVNTRKQSDTHADLTGKARVEGKDFWINIWKKKDKNGNTWLSMSFKPMEGHGEENQDAPRQQNKPQGKPQGGGKPQQQQLGEEEVPW